MLSVGRKIELPEDGLYTDDGLLFHHVGTVHLDAQQIARLQEYGVPYRVGANFKPSEDDQIRKNWEEFAEEYDLPPDIILYLCGSGEAKGEEDVEKKVQRRSFLLDTKFWPRMCQGLPHRSGNQVKRRILRIFDKAVVDGHATIMFGKKKPIKWSELMQIIRLYKQSEDINFVAEVLKKPLTFCRNAYGRFIEHNGRVFRQHWRTMWNVVNQLTGEAERGIFSTLLRRAIRNQDTIELGRLKKDIDFQSVAIAMTRKRKYCESAWDELISEFVKEYDVQKRKTENTKVAWAAAQKKVFQVMEPVSVDNFSTFLRLLTDCTHEDADYSARLKAQHCNFEQLSQLMVKQGVTGFHVGGSPITELECLFQKTRGMLLRCEKFVLSRLLFKYKLKERLTIVSRAFDSQIEAAIAEVEDPDSAEGKQRLKQLLTHAGHAVLKRTSYIEALILFTKKLDSDWIPPTKFQKYVKNPEVLELFPEEKDNSALLRHGEHKKLLKELAEWPVPGEPVEFRMERTDEEMED